MSPGVQLCPTVVASPPHTGRRATAGHVPFGTSPASLSFWDDKTEAFKPHGGRRADERPSSVRGTAPLCPATPPLTSCPSRAGTAPGSSQNSCHVLRRGNRGKPRGRWEKRVGARALPCEDFFIKL